MTMHKDITTYKELNQWIKIFHKEALDLMIIEGSAGSGKSTTIRKSLEDSPEYEYCWLEGRLTAIYLYEQAYMHRDCPIFLDDVDGLYSDKNAVNILKELCQTDDEKLVMWSTKTKLLDLEVPKRFTTKSKVCLITNSWRSVNANVVAVEDRGIVLSFYPSPEEVHEKALKLDLAQGDKEIYGFLESHKTLILNPSLRHYRNAKKLKDNGILDWKDVLIESFGVNDQEEIVLKLLEDKTLKTKQKAEKFALLTGKTARTFYRIKEKLCSTSYR